ncbi:RNA polymerase sigma factor RpoH [Buchnera aphidicola (Ceratoglyphina bambusae)]|uniref:RNA polymerase sigma factor RpoH n=1 Tax=Buchnera aphidicola TaxID=9 RepID=UPI0031B8ACCD
MLKTFYTVSNGSLGNLNSYIKLIFSWPVLDKEKEINLSKLLYYKNDLNAAKTLVLSNLRFVIHISKNYLGYGLLQSDLIQEGNIGLMKAVKKFNPKIGVRLISFAVHWIKSEIHEYILKNWRIVKVATTKSQRKLFFNIRKNKKKFGWFNKKELELVAEELGVTCEEVQEMESRMSTKDITFNFSSIDEKKDLKFKYISSYLKDKTSNFANVFEKDNLGKYNNSKLNNALLNLDKRSRYIINSRWLYNNRKRTLQSLAKYYGISAERVRQIEKVAMKKLKLEIEN